MLIMHGSTTQVPNPKLRKARFYKDFGEGFYTNKALQSVRFINAREVS